MIRILISLILILTSNFIYAQSFENIKIKHKSNYHNTGSEIYKYGGSYLFEVDSNSLDLSKYKAKLRFISEDLQSDYSINKIHFKPFTDQSTLYFDIIDTSNDKGEVLYSDSIEYNFNLHPKFRKEWLDSSFINYKSKQRYDDFEKVLLSDYQQVALLGEHAPQIEFPIYQSNKKLKIDDLKDTVVLLNFWGLNCGACFLQKPMLDSLSEIFTSRPVKFISISDLESKKWKKQKPEHLNNFELVVSKKIHSTFYVEGYPINILLDKKGRIVEIIEGAWIYNNGKRIKRGEVNPIEINHYVKKINHYLSKPIY